MREVAGSTTCPGPSRRTWRTFPLRTPDLPAGAHRGRQRSLDGRCPAAGSGPTVRDGVGGWACVEGAVGHVGAAVGARRARR